MILHFPTMKDTSLIQSNYELAKRMHSIVLQYFDATRENDVKWFQCSQAWLDHCIQEMTHG